MRRPVRVKCVNLDFLHKFQSGVEASAWWESLLTLEHSEEGEILRVAAMRRVNVSGKAWAGLREGMLRHLPQSWTWNSHVPLNTSHTGYLP